MLTRLQGVFMIKNYKLALMGLIVSCSLLSLLSAMNNDRGKRIETLYVLFRNPRICPLPKTTISKTDLKDMGKKYPEYSRQDEELFANGLKAALKYLSVSETDCSYMPLTGAITFPSRLDPKPFGLLNPDILISLTSLEEAFKNIKNIYKISDDYRDLEGDIKKRDEEFGTKKKIGS